MTTGRINQVHAYKTKGDSDHAGRAAKQGELAEQQRAHAHTRITQWFALQSEIARERKNPQPHTRKKKSEKEMPEQSSTGI